MLNLTLTHNIQKQCVLLNSKQILFSINHIQVLLKQIIKEKTSCIHTLFCTKETLKFYSKSDLHNKIPLIVNLPMSSDEILDQVNNLNFSFCSASIWNYNSKEDTNLEFKKKKHNSPN